MQFPTLLDGLKIALLVGLMLSPHQVACAEHREVVLLGGERFTGKLSAINSDSLVFAVDDGETRSVSIRDLARFANPPEPDRRPVVHLTDGSEFVVAPLWVGKPPLVVDDDHLTLRGTTYRETQVPRGQLLSIVTPAATGALIRESQTSAKQDRVWLSSGDRILGEIDGFDGKQLVVEIGQESTPIDFNRVAMLAIAGTEGTTPPNEFPQPALDIWLTDGSRLKARAISTDSGKVVVELVSGGRVRLTGLDTIAALVGYPLGIKYLSDIEAADYRHTPYFALEWPYHRDQNFTGQMLKASGHRYAKGIAMHSASRLVFRVPPGAERFVADIALDDSAVPESTVQGGSVIFRAYVVRDGALAPAFESEIVRGGDAPQPVEFDVADSPLLVLVVDFADRGDELDHAAWLDARFETIQSKHTESID